MNNSSNYGPWHAPHNRAENSASPDSENELRQGLARPSAGIKVESSDSRDLLEILDEAVYDAIAGKNSGLDCLAILWPQTLQAIGSDQVEPVREAYIAYAMSVWQKLIAEANSPEKAAAALDVLNLFLAERAG